MQLDIAFLCDAATEAGGKLNALGIGIDRLMVRQLPQAHPRLTVVARIAFDPGDEGARQLAIELVGPDGALVAPRVQAEMRVQINDPSRGTRANVIVDIANAKFTTAGPHEAKLSLDDEELVALPLEVTLNV